MIFATFYFSGTGNTKWVVEQFNVLIEKKANQAKAYCIDRFYEIKKESIKDIVESATYIGFAHPIYGANIPPIMNDFIWLLMDIITEEKIPVKPLYILNTFGYINAFGPFAAQKIISKECFTLIAYGNIRLCNNISTHSHRSTPITKEKLDIRKKKAIIELNKLINTVLSSEKRIKGIGPYLLPGIMIRKISKAKIKNHYQVLSIQKSTCTECMLCVKKCPTNSILYQDGAFSFVAECTACMRCYNFCPTASVLVDGIYTNPKEFLRYRGPSQL